MSVMVKKVASPRRNRRETNESDKTASTFTSKLDSDKVDKNDTPWITQEGREDMVKDFNFDIDDLPIKREIDRDVDVDELMDLEYITDGSSSNIFSARWRNEDVIVKVNYPISILLFASMSCDTNFMRSFTFMIISTYRF
jgi:hypothetical protein